MQWTDWAAKASFISIRSISSQVRPVFLNSLRQAWTGPSPIISGSQPASAKFSTMAMIFRPIFSAFSRSMTMTQLAPSTRGEELPAVETPSGPKEGFSFARDSMLQSSRRGSSRSKTTVLPPFTGTSTGRIWLSNTWFR